MIWNDYSRMIKSSFINTSSKTNFSKYCKSTNCKKDFDKGLAVKVTTLISPETVRRGCVKWATLFVEDIKPQLHQTWVTWSVEKKIDLVRATIEPIRDTCIALDQVLRLTTSAEKEFLVNCQKILLTEELILELRQLAKHDLKDESNSLIRNQLSKNLQLLDWLPRLEACFTEACYAAVKLYLKNNCSMIFDIPMLDTMLSWAKRVPGPWLDSMLETKTKETALRRLDFFVHQTFGTLRCSEFFDIITSFPESLAAVDDLKRCLGRTHAFQELINSVKDALKRRLLHGGANTNSILLVYVRLIKTMRHLDPKGVLLESVSDAVKQYLRSRPETVRCIVTALTNDSSGGTNAELYEELGLENDGNLSIRPIDFDFEDDLREVQDDDDDELDSDQPIVRSVFEQIPTKIQTLDPLIRFEKWEPDPIEANPKSSSKSRMSNDILGNLVRVYGSKELFVSEYRLLLSERLLTKTNDFDIEAEVRRLELLKLRFGESTMLACDVMLRDMGESRRANHHIKESQLETVVVSRHFWPQLQPSQPTDTFKAHPRVKSAMDTFAQRYSELKKPRRLVWASHLGVVDLEFTFSDGTKADYTSLSTIHANLALHLQDRKVWTLSDLAKEIGLEQEQTKKKMSFWVAEGVAIEDREHKTYTVSPTAPSSGRIGEEEEDLVDDFDTSKIESESNDLAAQQEQRDKANFEFITAMLINLGELSLEIIHRNLQMFSGATYDRSEQDLEMFLESCVNKGLLETAGDKFLLPKERS